MKKSNAIKWIAVVFILIAMAVVVLCLTLTRPWTDDTKQRKNADAERIAHNEFLFDDVYFVSPAKSKYVKTSPYALFTCGEKNGKTCLLIVPSSPDEKPYIIDWPFAAEYREMAEAVYNTPFNQIDRAKINVSMLIESYDSMIFANDELTALIKSQSLDIPFMLRFDGYAAVQIDGHIVVYRSDRADE